MEKSLRILVMLLALSIAAASAKAQQSAPDPRVADLVQSGKLRVGLHLAQYAKDPATGEMRGIGPGVLLIEIARAFSARLGVELVLVGLTTPPRVVECLNSGACDVGFVGIDPSRASEVDFSPAISQFDFTYLVPAGSTIRSAADVDRPGVRIAVVLAHASTLALRPLLKHAVLVGADIPDAAIDLVRTGRADVLAAPRPGLLEYSTQLPGSRVLEDRFGVNLGSAMVVRKGQASRLSYIREFIEEAKASGFVQRAIERSGERGVRVAPPG